MKNKELINLLNRAAAALETPADLTDAEKQHVIEDLAIAAQNIGVTPVEPYFPKGNMPNTYRQLMEACQQMNEDQLDSNISVQFDDEWMPAELRINEEDDVLDANHPVIYVP